MDFQDKVDALYRNTVCLAPMVRTGTLPMRMLALHYGADTVYGEEIIDKKIIATTRVENAILKTVDYVSNNGKSVVFRTTEKEKPKVVFQIGTADAALALKAANQVANDVAAIDINMGCPKHFSIQGGMGAALLSKPEIAADIIKTLRRNLNIPVSCKIRISEDTYQTLQFVKNMEAAGAVAIGIHARQIHERPQDPVHWDIVKSIPEEVQVPVIANGNIFYRENIDQVKKLIGCSSVMIARGAILNASIFRKEGTLPVSRVVEDYLRHAIDYENVYQNTKFNISRMISNTEVDPLYNAHVTVPEVGATKSAAELYKLFGLRTYYDEITTKYADRMKELGESAATNAIEPAHVYDDNYVLNKALYCEPCGKQMLSQQDLDLHVKGKKHKKKLRAQAAQTQSDALYPSPENSNEPKKKQRTQ